MHLYLLLLPFLIFVIDIFNVYKYFACMIVLYHCIPFDSRTQEKNGSDSMKFKIQMNTGHHVDVGINAGSMKKQQILLYTKVSLLPFGFGFILNNLFCISRHFS